MSDNIISVNGLAKRYRIGVAQERYIALRDVLTRRMKRIGRRLFQKKTDPVPKTEDFWALRDVTFDVRQGECLGVIGRNGAGKSTLLKLLSRITEPTCGEIRLRGRVGSLLEVGTGFHPELTGRENVSLNGAILGMTRKEIAAKFDEIVAFAEVEKFLDTPVKYYSSGMYTRLAFAVAAHLDPEILIVDEVLAVGDWQFQKKCLGKMGEVTKRGRTVLFVSHNMVAVASLCDRCLWLSEGQLQAIGPTKSVIAEYSELGGSSVCARRWEHADAPASHGIRLLAASATPADGRSDGRFTIRTPIRLEFEADAAHDFSELNFSIAIDEVERGCIFTSVSRPAPCRRGRLRGSFVIPPDFLNDGVYTVRVLVVRDTSVALVNVPNVLTFQVDDVERDGKWYGRWVGAVRPSFAWDVSTIPAANHEGDLT